MNEKCHEAWRDRPPIEVGNVVQLVHKEELLTREVETVGEHPPHQDHVMVRGLHHWFHVRSLTVINAEMPQAVQANFRTLLGAISNRDSHLMMCFERNHPEIAPIICAVSGREDGTTQLVPFARMLVGVQPRMLEPPIGTRPRADWNGEPHCYPFQEVDVSSERPPVEEKCEHEPDLSTLSACRDVPGIVDVVCAKCGQSASMQMDATDFDWGL